MTVHISSKHGALDDAEADAVRRLADTAAGADGVAPLGEQTLLDLTAPRAWHVLAHDEHGTPVGYAQLWPELGRRRTAELVVAPAARGTGVGTALMGAVMDLAGDAQALLWAHGTLPGATSLARHAGLAPVRELWRMALDLDAWASGATGSGPTGGDDRRGLGLRAFRPDRDEHAWLAANAAAFAAHPEQGRMTLADLRAREAEPWFDPAGLLLAERDDALVGFVWTKLVGAVGEIYTVGVVPRAQGTGLGRALTVAGLDHLRRRGAHRAELFTDADNAPAVHLYESLGFVVDRTDTQYATAG
ncbi:mycothiol synthase [Isoptericola sp. b441]|uniref:Mycothiol acetyltransferase n=1 Tax=Actinotalea lenta TaxID=3064654 RepID=A0ABT9D8D2_9CELL|nr:mycothiol synthase [Isoptericola sp. b441]MDO8106509.1 mycothiol synthase [Isoptericola sp. b441]